MNVKPLRAPFCKSDIHLTKSKFRHQNFLTSRNFYIIFPKIFNLAGKNCEVIKTLEHDLLQPYCMKL